MKTLEFASNRITANHLSEAISLKVQSKDQVSSDYVVDFDVLFTPHESNILIVQFAQNCVVTSQEPSEDREQRAIDILSGLIETAMETEFRLGGNVCIYRVLVHPTDFKTFYHKIALKGVMDFVSGNYSEYSDEQIRSIFAPL